MELIQIIIILFALFVLTRIILRLRDNQLTIREFFIWMALWGIVLLVAFIPSMAQWAASILGIGRGVDVFIYLALLVLFYMMFRIIIKLESLQHEMTSIVRKISLEDLK